MIVETGLKIVETSERQSSLIACKINFLWQSLLATGTVLAYSNVDAQVQYTFTKAKLNLKLGATNLLNKYYYSFIGGPAAGGFITPLLQ